MKRFFFLLSLLISVSIGQMWATDVADKLTASDFAATNTTYTDFSDVSKTSSAKYAGNSGKDGSGNIQMRSKNSNSGIVSTTSGGKVKSVKITVGSGANTVDVYGSNTAYTAASNLYNSSTQGTKIGSTSSTGTITFTADYEYVGIRSNNGAIYLSEVEITWTTSGEVSTPTDLTDQQFAWSATSATVTINANDNTFPSLTNTQQLSVTYQSTDQTVATISSTGDISLLKAGTTSIKAVFAGNANYNAKTVTYSLTVNAASETPSGDEVSDVLTQSWTGVSGTSYSGWSGKTATSDAVYAGNSAGGNSSIQLRSSNNNSGIITTASGGKAKSVTVEWNSNTASGRTIDIYGNNSAYSSAADLYSTLGTTQGAKLGSIACGTSTSLTITQDCEYIGIRSNNGALYLDKITIVWDASSVSSKEDVPEDKLKWSSASATVTKGAGDNVFPTLTNSLILPITYESTSTDVATISSNGTIELVNAGSTTIKAIFAGNDKYKAKTVSYELTVNPAQATPIEGGVIDVLNSTWSGLSSSTYAEIDLDAPTSTAHYKGNCAGDNNSIQLRSNNNNSGIVSTISAGKAKRVEVVWNSSTVAGRIVDVYGKNTAYSAATDLYNENVAGTKLGSITIGTSTFVDVEDDYKYIGFRSSSGALYLDEVRITWLPTMSAVTIDNGITNGSVTVTGASDLTSVAEGTELTLSNTPANGYKLKAYDVYKTGESSTKVTVTESKFSMPEYAVTVSATFEPLKTLTSIEITTPATQTTFWKGETFNYDGLVVTAHYQGAEDEVVTPTVTGSTATEGEQTVNVSYTEGVEKTTSYTITVRDIANTKETAFTVAEARDIIDKLGTASAVYAKGIVSGIVTAYSSQHGNISYNISADGTTESDQLQAFRGKSYDGENFISEDDIKVGDEVVVKGNLTKYNSTYEFEANNQLVSLKRTKSDADLAYETTSYEVNVGDEFTTPTLTNPHDLTVTYSSSDATVAEVNTASGAVTIHAMGSATITATFAGNDSYLAGSASYTITVSDPNVKTVTFDATVDTGESPLSKSNITMTCSNGVLNNESEYRLYKNSTTTFACSVGNITKIAFTGVSGKPISGFGEPEVGTLVTTGNNGVWTGNAASVSFTASGEQVRATKIVIYYSQDNRAEASLSWNPESVTLTIGETFTPAELQNPNSIPANEITIASDNEDLAVVNNGVVSLVPDATGTATITATFAGNATYKPAEVSYTITVNSASTPSTGAKYKKVTAATDITAGEYILVYEGETETFVWNGKDEASGRVIATLSNNSIAIPDGAVSLNIAAVDGGYSIQINGGDNDGKYVGQTADANGMQIGTTALVNTISLGDGGDAVIVSGGAYLRYNATSGQDRFRYYKSSTYSGQQPVQLYKKESAQPVEPDPEPEFVTLRSGLSVGEFGTYCPKQRVEAYAGATFFKFAYMQFVNETPLMAYFDELAEGEALEAGHPYFYITNAETITGVKTGAAATEGFNDHGFIGKVNTFEFRVTNEAGQDDYYDRVYVVYQNQIMRCSGGYYRLGAEKAYLDVKDVNMPKSKEEAQELAPGRRRVSINNREAPQVATGLDELNSNAQAMKVIINDQLFIIRGDKMYDTTGRFVGNVQ